MVRTSSTGLESPTCVCILCTFCHANPPVEGDVLCRECLPQRGVGFPWYVVENRETGAIQVINWEGLSLYSLDILSIHLNESSAIAEASSIHTCLNG